MPRENNKNEGSKLLTQKKAENSFLVFSDDFGEHPSSCQHLFHYVPDCYPVLWVNTVGMRTPNPTLRDFKKAVFKLKNMMFGSGINSDRISENQINVCQPPMLPFLNIPGTKSINKLSVYSTVNKRLNNLGMQSPIVVITAPNASDYIGLFKGLRTVYYCVDDFAEWPGLNKKLVQQMEKELIRKSDILIATSQNLFNKLSGQGKEVHLLTHGVDFDLFNNTQGEEHALLRNIPKPRVGYFGLFDDRSDKDLIEAVAKKMPDISFIITGNIETDVSSLKGRENIFLTGSIPYKELPAMAKGWDVCMLPYKLNKLTDAIQPLKIKEYLATGKPVISTPIREALKLKDYVALAERVDNWQTEIRRLLNGISLEMQKDREVYLKAESWEGKADKFFGICTGNVY